LDKANVHMIVVYILEKNSFVFYNAKIYNSILANRNLFIHP